MWTIARRLRRLLSGKDPERLPQVQGTYWEQRRQMAYYREVVRLAREFAPAAQSVLDVGPNGTPLVCELDWIGSKTVVDLAQADIPGATCIQGDFLTYQPEQTFDLVLCLQVLEHVGPAEAFARKLLDTGAVVIISVPYCWPAGGCKPHVHDPVDRAKLLAWTGKASITDVVVRDRRRERLIAVFEGNVQAAADQRAA
jgi:2-polyprenyl-3-methyl-5-hydroxy-6-metoxy-1,4-benzoquinol methylase